MFLCLTELASLILEWHPNVFNTFTEKGATPLHVLANKPGAFRSGTYLSLLDKLIYHCKYLIPNKSSMEEHMYFLFESSPRTLISFSQGG